jgi:hypothetical protein
MYIYIYVHVCTCICIVIYLSIYTYIHTYAYQIIMCGRKLGKIHVCHENGPWNPLGNFMVLYTR